MHGKMNFWDNYEHILKLNFLLTLKYVLSYSSFIFNLSSETEEELTLIQGRTRFPKALEKVDSFSLQNGETAIATEDIESEREVY